jgi:predicted transcriptional regulator
MHQFSHKTILATKRKETLLRSVLVTDKENRIVGLISLSDILRGIQPPCLRLIDDRLGIEDPALMDSSEVFCDFTTMVRGLALKKVRDIMPKKQPTIDANADLTEAVNRLLSLRVQSLPVVNGPTIVGIVRDRDIFMEITQLLRNSPDKEDIS